MKRVYFIALCVYGFTSIVKASEQDICKLKLEELTIKLEEATIRNLLLQEEAQLVQRLCLQTELNIRKKELQDLQEEHKKLREDLSDPFVQVTTALAEFSQVLFGWLPLGT